MTDKISKIETAILVQLCQGILGPFSRILRALTRTLLTDGYFEFCNQRTFAPCFCSNFSRASLQLSMSVRYEATFYNVWSGLIRMSCQRVPVQNDFGPYLQMLVRCSISKVILPCQLDYSPLHVPTLMISQCRHPPSEHSCRSCIS